MINNLVIVSGVRQSDSVTRIHVSILFKILFPSKPLLITEQSSLCYTVGPCWLSVLNIAVCTCQSHLSAQVTISSFSKSGLPLFYTCGGQRN